MPFFRTVQGDFPIASMGVCYSHEHVIIDNPFIRENFPEIVLDSVDRACEELSVLKSKGVHTMVDSMPMGAGRNVQKLAEISLRTGINIVCPTGLHLAKYYPSDHWSANASVDELVELFVSDITVGIDEFDNNSPIVHRTPHKAGLIKVAGSKDRLTGPERRNFQAAALAHKQTGCPILTHTEQGTAALEQVRVLEERGVDLRHVVLSHLDRNIDSAYHREVLQTGVKVEFDSAFRWAGGRNPTLELLTELAPDFPDSFVLGMDAAKSAYWASYGGRPGLAYLISEFVPQLLENGLHPELINRMFIQNPAKAYRFKTPEISTPSDRLLTSNSLK